MNKIGNPADNGTYSAKLKVTNTLGTSAEFNFEILLDNVDPDIALTGPDEIEINTDYNLSFSKSDPGPDTISSIVIDWADDTVDSLSGTATSASHVYTDEIDTVLVVSINDEDGSYNTTKFIELVSNAPSVILDDDAVILPDGRANLSACVVTHLPAMATVLEWDLNGDGLFDDANGTDISLDPDVTPVNPDAAANLAADSPEFWGRLRATDDSGRISTVFVALDALGQQMVNVADPFLSDPENDALDKRGTLRSGSWSKYASFQYRLSTRHDQSGGITGSRTGRSRNDRYSIANDSC